MGLLQELPSAYILGFQGSFFIWHIRVNTCLNTYGSEPYRLGPVSSKEQALYSSGALGSHHNLNTTKLIPYQTSFPTLGKVGFLFSVHSSLNHAGKYLSLLWITKELCNLGSYLCVLLWGPVTCLKRFFFLIYISLYLT